MMRENMDPIFRLCKIVGVVCTVEDTEGLSYRVNGVVQRAGDRCRLPLVDAEHLVSRGKARIVDGSENMVMG
jgi:hypothetical protein